METVRELLISLGLDVDQAKFVEAIGLEHLLEKGAELVVEAFKEATKAIADVVLETAKYGSELDDAAKKTGLTTQQLEEFSYAAKLVGGDAHTVQAAVAHLARRMGEVQNGSTEAAQAFARLGVRVFDANGKLRPVDAVLNDVSDGLHKTTAGTQRMTAAFGVMGRGGQEAIALLGEGSQKLDEIRQRYREIVGTLTEDQVQLLDNFDDSLVTLRSFFSQALREFAIPMIEALQPIVDATLEWVRANRTLIRQKLVELGRSIASTFRTIAKVLAGVGKVALFLVNNWKAVAVALGALAIALELGGAGFLAMGASAVIAAAAAIGAWIAVAAPVLLLAGLLTLVALAIEDVYGYLTGADSLLGDIGPKWTKFISDFTQPREEHWLVATLRQLLGLLTDFDNKWQQFKKDWEFAAREILPAMGFKKTVPLTPEEINARLHLQGGAAGPSQAAAIAAGATGVNVNGDTSVEIHVHPPPGSDPEQIADSVSHKMEDFFHRKLREAHAAAGHGK